MIGPAPKDIVYFHWNRPANLEVSLIVGVEHEYGMLEAHRHRPIQPLSTALDVYKWLGVARCLVEIIRVILCLAGRSKVFLSQACLLQTLMLVSILHMQVRMS